MRPHRLIISKLLLALSLGASLSGCAIFSDAPHYRGIFVTPLQLSELTPGVSTQADAQALLGPPTTQETFNANNWLYISQITKMRIGRTEGVKQQHVVVLNFDNNGTLQKITQTDTNDRVNVAMDTAKTPVPGGSASFLQQLVGGVGSYNPLGSVGLGASTPSAGAGGLGGGGFGSNGGSGGGL